MDLACELKKKELSLMESSEFRGMSSRLIRERRISVATLLNYPRKRRLAPRDVFSDQLAALFEKFASDRSEGGK